MWWLGKWRGVVELGEKRKRGVSLGWEEDVFQYW